MNRNEMRGFHLNKHLPEAGGFILSLQTHRVRGFVSLSSFCLSLWLFCILCRCFLVILYQSINKLFVPSVSSCHHFVSLCSSSVSLRSFVCCCGYCVSFCSSIKSLYRCLVSLWNQNVCLCGYFASSCGHSVSLRSSLVNFVFGVILSKY